MPATPSRVPGRPGVSTPNGPCSTRVQAMRMPASSARSCSRLSRTLERTLRAGPRTVPGRVRRIGVDADMVPERARRPAGTRGAGEIQRLRHGAAVLEHAGGLDEGGVGRLLRRLDRGHQGRDVDRRIRERTDHGAQGRWVQCRRVALHVHHHVMPGLRVQFAQRRMHPVGAGGQRRVGHDGGTAGLAHRLGDFGVGAGNRDGADPRLLRTVHHVHDHGQANDIGQRLAGQPGGSHARGNDDDGVQRRHSRV